MATGLPLKAIESYSGGCRDEGRLKYFQLCGMIASVAGVIRPALSSEADALGHLCRP